MKKAAFAILTISICMLSLASCDKLLPGAPKEEDILDGPVQGLSAEQTQQFLQGDRAFNDEIFTAETGLGPLFVATSCGSCHAGDGKGHPFSTLTRFGQRDSLGNTFLQQGGPQLQHRSISHYQPEQIPSGASFSSFTPPANTGLGFLDAVTDETLLSLADPQDANGDGISGRPNWIPIPGYLVPRSNSFEVNGKYMGRFGKKAAAYDLLHQTANAYNQDMGIASAFESVDTYSGREVDPEVSNQTVLNVVAYLKMLKAPLQRAADNEVIATGKQVFISISCGSCHVPEMKTGPSTISAISNQTFSPYTDLLLHDMGPALDDGYTEGSAASAEWKTPALWGLGLSKRSQGGAYFLLHDGRAHSLEEAILLHGGEAASSKAAYQQLSAADRSALLQFLESL